LVVVLTARKPPDLPSSRLRQASPDAIKLTSVENESQAIKLFRDVKAMACKIKTTSIYADGFNLIILVL